MTELLAGVRSFTDRFRGYPQSFLEADLRGNVEYPQMYTAQAIMGGAEVLRDIADGKLTWDRFFNGELSRRQLRSVRQKLFTTHMAFGIHAIPEKIGGGAKRKYRKRYPGYNPQYIPDDNIRGTIGEGKNRIIRTAVAYAQIVVPKDLQPKPNILPQNKTSTTDHERRPESYNIPLLNLLFSDPIYKQEADALVEMWQIAADKLRQPDARALGKTLREFFRHRTVGSPVSDVQDNLSKIITEAINKKLPDVPQRLVDAFVGHTVVLRFFMD